MILVYGIALGNCYSDNEKMLPHIYTACFHDVNGRN